MTHPFDEDAPTGENAILPWRPVPFPTERSVLHLVIAWFVTEAYRVGHVARVDRPCWFGRARPDAYPDPPVTFHQVRPGEAVAAPHIDHNHISRRQLELEPVDDGAAVRVRSVGLRKLFHNGTETTECVARAGDTLTLENTVVFLLEDRPPELPPVRFYPAPAFKFGGRDAHGIVGESPAIWRLREEIASVAVTTHHVLLLGPSGAGKEIASEAIHELSANASGPFVPRNAATFPEGLVDAELFGNIKNYPNPGTPERDGLFGRADGGTLLLDEIGELPQSHQVRLLRVLDSGGDYQRLGESIHRKSRFRLIGATNRDRSFLKHDLLARFPVVLELSGIEQRRGDIPFLIREVVRRLAALQPQVAARFLEDGAPKLDPELVERLLRHRYTLNMRELNRILVFSIGQSLGEYLTITPGVLTELSREAPADDEEAASAPSPPVTLEMMLGALRETGNNVTRAAAVLGVTRFKLYRLAKKHGVTLNIDV